jgi:hypothetical protein
MPVDQNWINTIVDASARAAKQQHGIEVDHDALDVMRNWAAKNEVRLRKKSRDGWGDAEFTAAAVRRLVDAHERQTTGSAEPQEPSAALKANHVQAAMEDCPNC